MFEEEALPPPRRAPLGRSSGWGGLEPSVAEPPGASPPALPSTALPAATAVSDLSADLLRLALVRLLRFSAR